MKGAEGQNHVSGGSIDPVIIHQEPFVFAIVSCKHPSMEIVHYRLINVPTQVPHYNQYIAGHLKIASLMDDPYGDPANRSADRVTARQDQWWPLTP